MDKGGERCLWLDATSIPYSSQHRLGSWDFKIVLEKELNHCARGSSLLGSLIWMLSYMKCNPYRINVTYL